MEALVIIATGVLQGTVVIAMALLWMHLLQ